MNKDELWKIYITRNPQFDGDGNVTMTKAGLRKLFTQTWEQAFEHGKKCGLATKEMGSKVDDIFGRIFNTYPKN